MSEVETSLARVDLDGVWVMRPGYGYGHAQSIASVAIRTQGSDDALRAVDRTFDQALSGLTDRKRDSTGEGPVAMRVVSGLCFWSSEVQRFRNTPAGHGQIVQPVGSQAGAGFQVTLSAWDLEVTRAAMGWCITLWNALAAGQTPTREALNESLAAQVADLSRGSMNYLSAGLAIERNRINMMRLQPDTYCLGTGARGRLLQSSVTDRTSVVAQQLAQNKDVTARLLRAAGLPAARNIPVNSVQAACEAARELGFPVVVKPAALDRGEGVSADLQTEQEVVDAYERAVALSPRVVVEKHIPGDTHRLTLVQGELVHARRRKAGGVIGDGTSTLAELIAADARTIEAQRFAARRGVPRLALDEEALSLAARAGLGADSVLPDGQYLRLRRRDNINAGGRNEEIDFATIHPANLQAARRAVQLLRLDFAGVDFIISDITRPWFEVDGGICEVNVRPQAAARDTHADYDRNLNRLLGPDPHVPADLYLTGSSPAEQSAAMGWLSRLQPRANVAFGGGVVLGGRFTRVGIASAFQSALGLALNPEVKEINVVLPLTELERMGLPLIRWRRITVLDEAALNPEDRMRLLRVLPMVSPHADHLARNQRTAST